MIITCKRRGSGRNKGSNKTELDQKWVLIFHEHIRCVHISCMLWLLTITSLSWSYRTSAIIDSDYMNVMKTHFVVLLFRDKYMLVCAIQMFLQQKFVWKIEQCHRSALYSRRVALASAQVAAACLSRTADWGRVTIRNKPASSTSVIWTLIL